MNKAFEGLSFKGIVVTGQIYVFSENESTGYQDETIDSLYTVRDDKEILLALEMDVCIVMAEVYEVKKFIGFEQIDSDCYVFKFQVFDKQIKKRLIFRLYLHRLKTLLEQLEEVKFRFGVSL